MLEQFANGTYYDVNNIATGDAEGFIITIYLLSRSIKFGYLKMRIHRQPSISFIKEENVGSFI